MPFDFTQIAYCYEYLVNQIPMQLLLYSHIPTALAALLFGGYVFYKVKDRTSFMLFMTCLMFAAWCFFDLGSWFAFLGPESTMLTWSLVYIASVLIFFYGYYFLYAFLTNNDIPAWQKYAASVLISPIIAYTFFGISLPVYDANSCAAIEDPFITQYLYFAESLFILASLILAFRAYRGTEVILEKKRILTISTGVLALLVFFFSSTFAVSLFAESDASLYVYNYEIYGLFGMPIFLVFLGYLIVRFKAFNIKLIAAQALVVGLVALIGAQLFFIKTTVNYILTAITLTIAIIGGYFLVKSVKQEVKHREEIALLATHLKEANDRLKVLDKMKSEFVSIASHQLHSPLTSIRGYVSMLLEGSYGKLPAKAQETLGKISDSSKFMALSIEDYLSVSRIEAGNMKYDMVDFNLKDMVAKLVDELRPIAMKKGLVMVFRSDCTKSCTIHADIGKVRQVIMNLVDNSMKYTLKGTITVVVHDNPKAKTVRVTIQDTGVGMSHETLSEVFDKFIRAKNAHNINVTGTGLGLYVAKKMVEEMKGKVWAESDGEGKGSTFCVEWGVE